jgi:hypothetical protein
MPIDAGMALQKELLDAYEKAGRVWLARVKSEVELWSELAAKLTTVRSVPDALESLHQDQRCLPCMQLMTNFLAGELLPPISLSVNPRDRASETHRLKLSLSEPLASARDVFAASVFFFWANTAVEVTTLIASAVVAVAKISRIAFLPVSAMNLSIGAGLFACPLSRMKPRISKSTSKAYFSLGD